LLDALPRDRPGALRAVGMARAGEQQAKVVVYLGLGGDSGARVAGRPLLVDRDRRRQPLDVVDVRLLHEAEELAGIGRERLDVAPPPPRLDRGEGPRRL